MGFFDADHTFVTLVGYDLSYLEFFGTAFNLLSVWLVVRRNVLTWPTGIVAVALFCLLFYQINLYSDFVEQIYFLITGFYGWWVWIQPSRAGEIGVSGVSRMTSAGIASAAAIIAAGSVAMGAFFQHADSILPRIFPDPASYPYVDAVTTVMSFTAQLLMAHKKIESWLLWITVDVIGIWLYTVKDVKFIAMLYAVFLVLAIRGLGEWWRVMRNDDSPTPARTAIESIG
jgi:nicotinamide mononucleotide transporter